MRNAMIGAVALIVLCVVAILGMISIQPSEYTIERSAVVRARPAIVYGLVANFHAWPAWSPWEELDPDMEHTYSGAEMGEGASTSWKSPEAGAGTMTIAAASQDRIAIKLEFTEPFPSKSDTVFTMAPEGDGTKVTWTMRGTNDFMGKAFSMAMDMDAMVGSDFEKGLGKLDAVAAEAESKRKAEEAAAAAAEAAEAAGAEGQAPNSATPQKAAEPDL